MPDVADSEDGLDENDEFEMFADDTNGVSVAPTFDELMEKLQVLANRLLKWASENGMIIHPGKTKVMVFSPKLFIGPAPNITMNDRSLEIVKSHKVLGTIIDDKLSWKAHTDKVISKFNAKVKLLKRMMSLSNEILEKFYFATIIPTVTYNMPVWGQPDKFSPLEDIHVKAAKLIHRLPSSLSNHETLNKVKWMPISYIYKRRLLCMMHKVYHQQIDVGFASMFSRDNGLQKLSRKQQLSVVYDTGLRSFSHKAVKIWNRMPNELTEIESHKTFKEKLVKFKTKIDVYSFKYNSYNIDDDFIFY